VKLFGRGVIDFGHLSGSVSSLRLKHIRPNKVEVCVCVCVCDKRLYCIVLVHAECLLYVN
jgi:hypothetical protein